MWVLGYHKSFSLLINGCMVYMFNSPAKNFIAGQYSWIYMHVILGVPQNQIVTVISPHCTLVDVLR